MNTEIKKIWDQFDILTDYAIQSYSIKYERGDFLKEHLDEAFSIVHTNRKLLLELCQQVYDMNGSYTELFFSDQGHIVTIFHPLDNHAYRCDNSKTLREIASAYSFMEWERQQRLLFGLCDWCVEHSRYCQPNENFLKRKE